MSGWDVAKGVGGLAVTVLFTVAPALLHLLGYETFGILAPYMDAIRVLAPFGLFFGGTLIGLFLGALWTRGKIAAAGRERDEAVAAAERERDEAVADAERMRERVADLVQENGKLGAEARWLDAKLARAGYDATPEQRRREFDEWLTSENLATDDEVRRALGQGA